MSESESFDAFYARTVWNVTSQMHALAGEDSVADHAIREAYARAYQKWYEIADNPDTEGWVLAVAREAYLRRRPEAASTAATPAGAGHDSLSWPGLYRPRAPAGTSGDPDGTIGGPLVGMAAAPTVTADAGPAAGLVGRPAAAGIGLVTGPPAGATAALVGRDQAAPPAPPGSRRQPGQLPRPGSRGRLVALTSVIALIAAGAAVYLATARNPAPPTRHHTATKTQGPVMLGAGKTGLRTAIPWSLVEKVPGWTLAEVSTAPAGTSQPGTITTYLVDPEGGRYLIRTSSPGVTPQLLAWSGNAQNALFAVPSGSSGASYELLSLSTGEMTNLALPANVTAVGFSRPDGENILAVRTASDSFKLQRYDLQGQFQATIGSLPRKAGSPEWLPGCAPACGALSSPNGDTDVWGIAGDEMQLVGNATPAKLITRLKVPGADSCVPLTWWDTSTVLAYCGVSGQPSAGQLWQLPIGGSQPTQLTQTSGSPSGNGDLVGAWQDSAGGATYAAVMNFNQCQGAPSGPGGLAVVPVGGDGSLQQPINLQGATNNHTSVVSAAGGKLLVLAQTSCPGTSSLLRFDPSTGATTTVLAGQAGQVGVLAAVPFGGLAPTATNGQ